MQELVCTAIHTYHPGKCGLDIFELVDQLMSLLINSLAAVGVEHTVFPVTSSCGEDELVDGLIGIEELFEEGGVSASEEAPDVPEPPAHIVVSHIDLIAALSRAVSRSPP